MADDVGSITESSRFLMFTDDLKLFSAASSAEEKAMLQADLGD